MQLTRRNAYPLKADKVNALISIAKIECYSIFVGVFGLRCVVNRLCYKASLGGEIKIDPLPVNCAVLTRVVGMDDA